VSDFGRNFSALPMPGEWVCPDCPGIARIATRPWVGNGRYRRNPVAPMDGGEVPLTTRLESSVVVHRQLPVC
jgi:hypothetical protein